ncbi:hypothetical protein N9N28_05875 [Rubripirellula amarantea]|nr:hypothetical protein [Rubripirellula amarantea]
MNSKRKATKHANKNPVATMNPVATTAPSPAARAIAAKITPSVISANMARKETRGSKRLRWIGSGEGAFKDDVR